MAQKPSSKSSDTSSSSFSLQNIEKLSPNIRFGGSSWTYPGWKGLIYFKDYPSDRAFTQNSFEEYAHFPLFRTVGIDRFFYTPPKATLLTEYDEHSPDDFKWVSKVWERITIPHFPKHPRYGKDAGRSNPDFLNANLFCREVLAPYEHAKVEEKTGPFVLQFPWIASSLLAAPDFFGHLKAFLEQLPSHFSYATEIRNREYLTVEYFDLLNRCSATHCFNHWTNMPPLAVQMKHAAEAGGLTAPFFVARILTPLGLSYQQAVKRFEPYKQVQLPNPEMRRDVVRLIKRALEKNITAFVIVNNRAEGNSPMTIDAISTLAVETLGL